MNHFETKIQMTFNFVIIVVFFIFQNNEFCLAYGGEVGHEQSEQLNVGSRGQSNSWIGSGEKAKCVSPDKKVINDLDAFNVCSSLRSYPERIVKKVSKLHKCRPSSASESSETCFQEAVLPLSEGRLVVKSYKRDNKKYLTSYFVGELPNTEREKEQISKFLTQFDPRDFKTVSMVVDSIGGSLDSAKTIADWVKLSFNSQTYVPAGGECTSSCVILLSAGKRKFVDSQGSVGLHQCTVGQKYSWANSGTGNFPSLW